MIPEVIKLWVVTERDGLTPQWIHMTALLGSDGKLEVEQIEGNTSQEELCVFLYDPFAFWLHVHQEPKYRPPVGSYSMMLYPKA